MTNPGSDPLGSEVPNLVQTNVVSPARIYDYWLGGKDNFPIDREAGDAVLEVLPASGPGSGPTGRS
jgi:S-adenosyl methyltransferase